VGENPTETYVDMVPYKHELTLFINCVHEINSGLSQRSRCVEFDPYVFSRGLFSENLLDDVLFFSIKIF
jgi:hypothetical protein